MLWQFHTEHKFDAKRTSDGLRLMAWGFFKKLVIADNLAIVVNSAYKTPGAISGLSLLVATYFFAFQIYCDFSGYTDISRGASRIMGIELMQNFKLPYFSKSISEFWRRWHISLSSWFSDYVYISLGGNRCSKRKWFRNLMIVFILSGLWHGAAWTYVIWGALNGLYLVIGNMTKNMRQKLANALYLDKVPQLHKVVKVFITFHLICFSWIFFRAASLSDATFIIQRIFTDHRVNLNMFSVSITRYHLLLGFGLIAFLLAVQLFQRTNRLSNLISGKPLVVRWGLYYAGLILFIVFGVFSSSSFIYFQF